MTLDNLMWTSLDEEEPPHGCTPLELMWEDGSVTKACSCDIHWDIHLNRELPLMYRLDPWGEV